MSTPSPSGPTADSLFAAWLARYEAGEEPDLEALCQEQASHAGRLRALHAHWAEIETVRRQHGLGGSLTEKLETRYGSGVDPHVTLEGEGQVKGNFSSEVLSRLAERGSASTRYRVKGEVARGGMGAVLRVWDEELRRHLAMKVMIGKGVAAEKGPGQVDPKELARFLEEAQVTGQLDHPGVVPVHELGLDAEGRMYFTMKLVKGKTLKEVFDELARGEGGWTQTRVLGLILKVCEAMSYAHSKGVIHRDLKPTNVMVGRFGEVFVMDWGVARVLSRDDKKDLRVRERTAPDTTIVHSERHDRAGETPDSLLYTMDGDVVGTPAYMSPEQAAGDLEAMGPHSDVYAVGALLYHLLAGHSPYVPPGSRVNSHTILYRVQEGPPPALHKLAPHAPAELLAICERAMSRDPGARYSTMLALGDDLSAFVERRVVHAYETGAWAEARKWTQRNRPLAMALAAMLVLLVAGLVSSLLLKAQSDANAEDARLSAGLADAKAHEAKANLALAQRNEAEAEAQRAQAEAERSRAEENERLAREETAKVLRLSDAKVLQELEVEADKLWPAYPDEIPSLESWLDRARRLAGRLAAHRVTLSEMRVRALPWTREERMRDRESHPRASELADKQSELSNLIAQLGRGLGSEVAAQADQRAAELDSAIATLTEQVESRRTWHFDSPEDQWQHDVLAELVRNLERLEAGLLAADVTTPDHGWSVPKRLTFAQELEAGFRAGGKYSEAWNLALPAIRESYPGLDLKPQLGLLPIGPDPKSGLWEFAHLMTGAPAERGPDENLVLTEETGVVLVLLRGGSFWMGAQPSDPNGRNYDPQAQREERPVHEVELSAFFLSKYELTQGQWLRLTGRNPSAYSPQGWSYEWLSTDNTAPLLNPVEQISWEDSMAWLSRADLALPSEAQWEYGARGGTDTPWWTGARKETLSGAANLEDKYAHEHGDLAQSYELWLDDGAAVHAPVGTYAPNAFGLHDVVGSLWEWCLDEWDGYYYGRSPRVDPVFPSGGVKPCVARGGAFNVSAIYSRSAQRNSSAPELAYNSIGARPARAIDP